MKRVLVISNEPFSNASSNGRTMKMLFGKYDKDKIAQFYLHGVADTQFCSKYYCISDRDALNAFLHRKRPGQREEQNSPVRPVDTAAHQGYKPVVKRSCRNLLLRDIIWSSNAWWDKQFGQFLTDFAPEVVLLQGGDAPFLFALAQKIARQFHAALVQFTTENYVLKHYMYSEAHKEKLWHFFLQRRMKRRYASFMKQADHCIYSTDQLEEDYQQRYPHPGKSTVLYAVTELLDLPAGGRQENEYFRVVYCGNLGVGRVQPLAELAQVLREVDPQARLEVYGRFLDDEGRQLVCGEPSVDYRGVVDYGEVVGILRGADMIVHCENAERLKDLWAAFSTKIADSLGVGTPFLVYADRRYPFVKYLLKHECAHVAGDRTELKEVLTRCIENREYREQFLASARQTAEENHSARSVRNKFNHVVQSLCGDEKS